MEEHVAEFSPCTEEWQFASVEFSKEKYRIIQYVQVYCDYSYNCGAAYFDNIQLTRNSVETGLSASDFVTESTGGADDADETAAEDTAPAFEEKKDAYGNALTETTFTDGSSGRSTAPSGILLSGTMRRTRATISSGRPTREETSPGIRWTRIRPGMRK